MKNISKILLFSFLLITIKTVNAQNFYYGEFHKEDLGIHGEYLLTLKEDNTFLFHSKVNTDNTYLGTYKEEEQHIVLNLKETSGSDICIYQTPKENWNMLKKIEENLEYSLNDEPIQLNKISESEYDEKIKTKFDSSNIIYCQELVNPNTKEGYYYNQYTGNEFVLYKDNHVIWYEAKDAYKIGQYHVEETKLNFDFTTECVADKCYTMNKAMDLKIDSLSENSYNGSNFIVSYQGYQFKQVLEKDLKMYQESDKDTKVDPSKRHYYIYIGVIIVVIIFIVSKIAFRHKK